jgi:hypothetical protein
MQVQAPTVYNNQQPRHRAHAELDKVRLAGSSLYCARSLILTAGKAVFFPLPYFKEVFCTDRRCLEYCTRLGGDFYMYVCAEPGHIRSCWYYRISCVEADTSKAT